MLRRVILFLAPCSLWLEANGVKWEGAGKTRDAKPKPGKLLMRRFIKADAQERKTPATPATPIKADAKERKIPDTRHHTRSVVGPTLPPLYSYQMTGSSGNPEGIALCLTGEARTFMMPLVHQRIKKNLVDTLAADLFAVIKKSQSNKSLKSKEDRANEIYRDEESCEFDELAMNGVLHDIMRAKDIRYVYSEQDLKPIQQCNIAGGGSAALANKEVCFDMVVKAEDARQRPYGIWVTTRPDLLVTVPVHPTDFTKPAQNWAHADFLLGGPREYMVSWLIRQRKALPACDLDVNSFEELLRHDSKDKVILWGNGALVRGLSIDGRLLIQSWDGEPKCLPLAELQGSTLPKVRCAGISHPFFKIHDGTRDKFSTEKGSKVRVLRECGYAPRAPNLH